MLPTEGLVQSAAAAEPAKGFIEYYVSNVKMDVTTMTYAAFMALSVACFVLLHLARHTKAQLTAASNPHFVQFQRQFFAVYFLALFSDWLQGPYVYKLYSHYGFAEYQIAVIYVVGFAASVVFGTATGPLADRFGRKKTCIAFSVAYSLCCLTKLSRTYAVLLLGRVFGGIATSMLFSTFESWYVYEHVETHDFPAEWIAVTFSKATFWNGILAIVAGVASNMAAEWLGFGPVAPFLMAIPCLVACGGLVSAQWQENYGNQQINLRRSYINGLRTILASEVVALLGLIQSLFESVMYMFVFLWTPILDPSQPPLGMVFSCFMVCIMMGSSLNTLLMGRGMRPERVLTLAVAINIVCMLVCTVATGPGAAMPGLAFAAFLFLELAVGMYFPSMGYLRSQVIPEEQRASIMNWFRVPMNLITCGGLLWLHQGESAGGNQVIFMACAGLLMLALVACLRFSRRYQETRLPEKDLTESKPSAL
ncbi:molybdate-anion transporter-like [Amphibalanus amphitrite]|nr:molybdate-anion transporter-like [Amphibalanus amphitrite]